MRVLFVCSSLSGGGAERFVSTALCRIDRSRFDVSLCLFRRELAYPLPDDVPVIVLEKRRPWHIPPAIVGLARLVDRLRPAVIFSAFMSPNFITGNALLLSRHRPAWIARVSSNPDYSESGALRPWMRALYNRADRVLTNSEGLCAGFRATYPTAAARAGTLPNATDFEQLDALAAETQPPDPAASSKRFTLVSVGRLAAVKRVDLQIDAIVRLRDRLDVGLVVCGDGPLRRRLERRVAELGVGDRVEFRGFLANPYTWMRRADAFLLSSDFEGSPNALIEAQGLGLPAVSTDCDYGPREIIAEGKTGLLVPTDDADALATALVRLFADADGLREMGAAAHRRAHERYAAGTVVQALERELADAASARGTNSAA